MIPSVFRSLITFLEGQISASHLSPIEAYAEFERLRAKETEAILDSSAVVRRISLQVRMGTDIRSIVFPIENQLNASMNKEPFPGRYLIHLAIATGYYSGFYLDEAARFLRSSQDAFLAEHKEWFKWDSQRIKLLGVLINDAANRNTEQTKAGYSEIVTWSRQELPAIFPAISMMAGIFYRKLDEYEVARLHLGEALRAVESDDNLRAILMSNLGALAHLQDDYQKAAQLYGDSAELFLEAGSYSLGKRAMLNQANALQDLGWANAKIPEIGDLIFRIRSIKDVDDSRLVDRNENEAYESYLNSTFQENVKGPYSRRMADDVGEFYRELMRAAFLAEHLGHLSSQRAIFDKAGKGLFNLGMLLDAKEATRGSLSFFVLSHNRDGIAAALSDEIPFSSVDSIRSFAQWLLSISGDRKALLGSICAFEHLSPNVPDDLVDRICNRLWELSKKGYSFNTDFDFERPSLSALSRICHRVSPELLESIISDIQVRLPGLPPLMKSAIADFFVSVPWEKIQSATKNTLVDLIIDGAGEPNSAYSDGYLRSLVAISRDVHHDTQKKVADFLFEYDEKTSFRSAAYLSNAWLASHLSSQRIGVITQALLSIVEKEMEEASLQRYAFGGFDGVLSLSYFYRYCSQSAKPIVARKILDYAANHKLVPQKRTSALMAILEVVKHKQNTDFANALEVLSEIVTKPYADQERAQFREDDFAFILDTVHLRALGIVVLETLYPGRSSQLLNHFYEIVIDIDSRNGPTVVRALEIACLNTSSQVVAGQICAWLYHFTGEAYPPAVIGRALLALARTIEKRDIHFESHLFVERMMKLATNPDHRVRRGVVRSIECLKEAGKKVDLHALTDALLLLKNDVHEETRELALSVSLEDDSKNRPTTVSAE